MVDLAKSDTIILELPPWVELGYVNPGTLARVGEASLCAKCGAVI